MTSSALMCLFCEDAITFVRLIVSLKRGSIVKDTRDAAEVIYGGHNKGKGIEVKEVSAI